MSFVEDVVKVQNLHGRSHLARSLPPQIDKSFIFRQEMFKTAAKK